MMDELITVDKSPSLREKFVPSHAKCFELRSSPWVFGVGHLWIAMFYCNNQTGL